MNTLRMTVTGILLLAFTMNNIGAAQQDNLSPQVLVDDIEEYNGSIGPDNALYGLKLAFEILDESFTFNTTEKLEKKVYHSNLRLSEAKTELKKKNNEGAKKAFENYKEKINETENSISNIKGNYSGILNAQKMIEKHQYVLERLLESHPDNGGLLNAYNKSVELEDKFEEKTERKLERVRTEDGKQYLKELGTEKEANNEGDGFLGFKNYMKLNARIIDNKTQIELKLNFISNKTDNLSIANDIVNQLKLSKENISNVLEIENSTNGALKSILEAKASIGTNVSGISVDYMFTLDKTNRTEIIDGIFNNISTLTRADILNVLEIKAGHEGIKQDKKESEENGRKLEEKPGKNEKKQDDHETKQERKNQG